MSRDVRRGPKAIVLSSSNSTNGERDDQSFRTYDVVISGCTAPTRVADRMWKETKLMSLVMLVDDADVERAAVRRLLEREGYDVVEAADGLDALAVLEGSRPALILLDLSMPDLDGLELLRFLRDDVRWQSIPVVV